MNSPAACLWALLFWLLSPLDPTLARFEGGRVGLRDLLAEARHVAPSEIRYREHVQMPLDRVYADWIRRIALRKIASDVAVRDALVEDDFLFEKARGSARDWLLAEWQNHCFGQPVPPAPAIEALDSATGVEPGLLPARIRLSHIFLRARSPAEEARAIEALGLWRGQIHGLEGFREIARKHSQSQSARKGGALGFLRQGWLPDAAESVLYQLEPGTMSEPLCLNGGCHLFFVEAKAPPQPRRSESAKRRVQAQRQKESRLACRERALAAAALSIPVVELPGARGPVPDRKVGARVLRASLLQRLADSKREPVEAFAHSLLEQELLYQAALADPWLDAGRRWKLAALQADVWLDEVVARRAAAPGADPTEPELRQAFDSKVPPLRHLPQLQLEVLKAALPPDIEPLAFFDRLEQIAGRLRSGQLAWEAAGLDLPDPGTRESWPLQDTWSLAGKLPPQLFDSIHTLPAGSVFGPFQDGLDFYVVGILQALPARPLSFEEARPKLRRQLIQARRKAATAQAVADLLGQGRFALTAFGAGLLDAID